MNLVTVPSPTDGSVSLGGVRIPVPGGASDTVTVGIRPEDLRPAGAGDGLEVTVDVVEELGADAYVYGTLTDGSGTSLVARTDARVPPGRGDRLRLAPDPQRIHVFDGGTGGRLA
jgi:multiple sugar transport system ATP-binding protein